MVDFFNQYKLCPVCDGDGVVTTTSSSPPYEQINYQCPECLGPNAKFPKAGGIYTGWIEPKDED